MGWNELLSAILTVWMAGVLLATFSAGLYLWHLRPKLKLIDSPPRTAVIVPIKGAGARMAKFFARLAKQNHVAHRLIFTVESELDEAYGAISRFAAASSVPIQLVVSGPAVGRGQKVHNLLAALATLQPTDEVVAFADADILPGRDWLAQLIRPITLGRAKITSGYVWMVPLDQHMASRIATLISASVATTPRDGRWNLCSGASTAIERSTLDSLSLPNAWNASLSDDLTLTRVARRAGLRIHATHRSLVPCPMAHDWRSLFSYGHRQYTILRLYAPRHWWTAGFALSVAFVGSSTALVSALAGDLVSLSCLILSLALQLIRAMLRESIARRVLPSEHGLRVAERMRRDRYLLPAAHLVNLAMFISSALGRTVVWAGKRYRIDSLERVTILSSPPLP